MFTFNLSVPTVQLQPPSSSSEAFQMLQLCIEGELTLAHLGNLLTFTVELKCNQFHALGYISLNRNCFTWKWGMLNTAVTNMQNSLPVGEDGPLCLLPSVPLQCCSWESRLPWCKVLPGTCRTSQVLFHLSTAVGGWGVPSSTCHVCLCAQCWGNTVLPVPPAGQQSLLASHHVSGSEEGLRSRVWQLAAGLGWGFWRRNAAQHPGEGLCRVWVTPFVTTDRELEAIVPLGLGTQRQLREWRTLLRAAQLTPLPLLKGCDIYMANTQQFSFMGNSR